MPRESPPAPRTPSDLESSPAPAPPEPSPATRPSRPPRPGDHRPLRGIGHKLLSTLGFSLMLVCAKEAARELPSPVVVLVRSAVMVALLLPFLLARRVPLVGRSGWLHLRCAVGVAALQLNYWSLGHCTLADAVVLIGTSPLWVPIVAYFALGERPRPAAIVLQLVGFTGVVLVAGPAAQGAGGARLAHLAALAAGVFIALGIVFLKKATTREHPLTIVSTFAIWTLLTALPAVGAARWEPVRDALWVLVPTGLFALCGQLFLTRALSFAPAGIIAILNHLGVALSFLFGFLFFDEIPAARGLAGASVIVVACVATTRLAARSGLVRTEPVEGAAAP